MIFTEILSVNVTGGVAPYTYLWHHLSGPLITFDDVNSPTPIITFTGDYGTYALSQITLTVTDNEGTVDTTQMVVNCSDFAPLQINTLENIIVGRSTPGIATKSLQVNVTGGIGPFTHNWERTAISNVPDPVTGNSIPVNTTTKSTLSSTTVSNPNVIAAMATNDSFQEQWKLTTTDTRGVSVIKTRTVFFRYHDVLSASVLPTSFLDTTDGTVRTYDIVLSILGGYGDVIVEWSDIDGNNVTSINDPTDPTPSVTCSAAGATTINDVWRATISDLAGNTVIIDVLFTITVAPNQSQALTIEPHATFVGTGTAHGTTNLLLNPTVSGGTAPYTFVWVEEPLVAPQIAKKVFVDHDTNTGHEYQWTVNLGFGKIDLTTWVSDIYLPFYVAKYGPTDVEDIVHPTRFTMFMGDKQFDSVDWPPYVPIDGMSYVNVSTRNSNSGQVMPTATTGTLVMYDAGNEVIGTVALTFEAGTPVYVNEQF